MRSNGVFQLGEFLDNIKVKDKKEGMRIAECLISYISYLSPGEMMTTSNIRLSKISDDCVYINSRIEYEEIADELSDLKFIKEV